MFGDIFSRLDARHERDGQTDRHWMTAKTALKRGRAVKTTLTFAHAPLYPVTVSFQGEYG